MIEHLGLRWNKACLDFHISKRSVTTASRSQVRRPIYKDAVGRWRTYETWLQPLLNQLRA